MRWEPELSLAGASAASVLPEPRQDTYVAVGPKPGCSRGQPGRSPRTGAGGPETANAALLENSGQGPGETALHSQPESTA